MTDRIETLLPNPAPDYNIALLEQELSVNATFESTITRGDEVSAILSSDAQQSDIDEIQTIATNHDGAQITDDQRALEIAQIVISGINTSIKIFPEVTALYNVRVPYLTSPPGTYTIEQSYNAFRALMDTYATGTPNQQITFALMVNYARDNNADYMNPPNPITDDYRAAILNACFQLISSITMQFDMSRRNNT